MCLSLVYDILKLSTVQFVNSRLSYASDYVCLLELVNSSACFWRDYRVWYDAGMLHKCCRMCLSLLYDILRSLSNVHLWISKPPREWLCLLVGASHSCALTWPESVPRSSRPRCVGLVFAVPRKLYLIYACAMLLIREEFSPRGKRYSPQPLCYRWVMGGLARPPRLMRRGSWVAVGPGLELQVLFGHPLKTFLPHGLFSCWPSLANCWPLLMPNPSWDLVLSFEDADDADIPCKRL